MYLYKTYKTEFPLKECSQHYLWPQLLDDTPDRKADHD